MWRSKSSLMGSNTKWIDHSHGFGFPFIFGLVIFINEQRRILSQPATAWLEDQSADCAIVLTGGPFRIREGMDLLSQGKVKNSLFQV
ncbi:MAG: hypothetical protein R2827_02480 [Bdellovibrionales bacterium]